VEAVIGIAEALLSLRVWGLALDSAAVAPVEVSIGVDSTTAPAGGVIGQTASCSNTIFGAPMALLEVYPSIGRHVFTWLERSGTAAVTTWYGDNADVTKTQSGMTGSLDG